MPEDRTAVQAPPRWLHERQRSEDNGRQSKDNEKHLFSPHNLQAKMPTSEQSVWMLSCSQQAPSSNLQACTCFHAACISLQGGTQYAA